MQQLLLLFQPIRDFPNSRTGSSLIKALEPSLWFQTLVYTLALLRISHSSSKPCLSEIPHQLCKHMGQIINPFKENVFFDDDSFKRFVNYLDYLSQRISVAAPMLKTLKSNRSLT